MSLGTEYPPRTSPPASQAGKAQAPQRPSHGPGARTEAGQSEKETRGAQTLLTTMVAGQGPREDFMIKIFSWKTEAWLLHLNIKSKMKRLCWKERILLLQEEADTLSESEASLL